MCFIFIKTYWPCSLIELILPCLGRYTSNYMRLAGDASSWMHLRKPFSMDASFDSAMNVLSTSSSSVHSFLHTFFFCSTVRKLLCVFILLKLLLGAWNWQTFWTRNPEKAFYQRMPLTNRHQNISETMFVF